MNCVIKRKKCKLQGTASQLILSVPKRVAHLISDFVNSTPEIRPHDAQVRTTRVTFDPSVRREASSDKLAPNALQIK